MTGPDETETRRLRAIVRGRVQGVNFRAFTAEHARRLGLVGWVRNLLDGRTVEVVAEGPLPALEALLARLREGPRFCRVETVDAEWLPAQGSDTGFEVVR